MKKVHILFLLLLGGVLLMQQSCVDKAYDLDDDNLDKNAYVSPDGISIPLPGVDTIKLIADLNLPINTSANTTTRDTIFDLFSEDTNEQFFSTEYPSDFQLKAFLDVKIQNKPSTYQVEVTPTVLEENAQGTIQPVNITTLTTQVIKNMNDNTFLIKINKGDMVKMQKARHLELKFDFKESVSVTANDAVIIKSIVLSKAGGFHWTL